MEIILKSEDQSGNGTFKKVKHDAQSINCIVLYFYSYDLLNQMLSFVDYAD